LNGNQPTLPVQTTGSSLPVVDDYNVIILGIVTIDDVCFATNEEFSEDIQKIVVPKFSWISPPFGNASTDKRKELDGHYTL